MAQSMPRKFDEVIFDNLNWKNDVRFIIATIGPERQRFHLRKILGARRPLSQEDTKDLASAIVACATDFRDIPANAGNRYAVVTNMVCDISEDYMPDSARFLRIFKEVLNETFYRYWGNRFTRHSDSIGRTSSPDSVNEGLALCAFIGSLCTKRIVSYHEITKDYIPAIGSDVPTLEHMVAMEKILNNAGSSLWQTCVDPQDAAKKFLEDSFVITDRVIESCHTSILGCIPHGIATVSGYIQHVADKARYYASHAEDESIPKNSRRLAPYHRQLEA